MKEKTYPLLGLYSFVGLLCTIWYGTYLYGVNYKKVLQDFLLFLTGDIEKIEHASSPDILSNLMTISVLLLVKLFLSFFIGIAVTYREGDTTSFSDPGALARGRSFKLFLLILGEEVFARLIPLVLLTKVLEGKYALYGLMLTGNLGWTLFHLYNYTDPKERSVWRVASQFVGGLFYAYVCVYFGFWYGFLLHYIFDILLFSMNKVRKPTAATVLNTIYYLIVAVIALLLMDAQSMTFSEFYEWLTAESTSEIVSTPSLWELTLVIIGIQALATILANMLLLDSDQMGKDVKFIHYIWAIPLYLGIIYVLNWSLSFVVTTDLTRALILSIFVVTIRINISGSNLARRWLIGLPLSLVFVFSYTHLEILGSLYLAAVATLMGLVPAALAKRQQVLESMQTRKVVRQT